MLNLALGRLIHEERQREIELRLRARRLLEPAPQPPCEPARSARVAPRHNPAGAAS